jgi:formate hydrogenlyase subunit 6/NADH:ubiquinone oxidoreductase subunit I
LVKKPVILNQAIHNLIKKPATEKYPAEKAKVAEGFRGEPALNYDLCIGCGLCSKECPSQAIVMVEADGKKHPEFLLDRCIFCYHCAEVCPKHAIVRTDAFNLASLEKSSLTVEPKKSEQTET